MPCHIMFEIITHDITFDSIAFKITFYTATPYNITCDTARPSYIVFD